MLVKWSLSLVAGLCILSFSQCQWPPQDKHMKLCRPDDGSKSICLTRKKHNEKAQYTPDCHINELYRLFDQLKKQIPNCPQHHLSTKQRCCMLNKRLESSLDSENNDDEETKPHCGRPCENNGHCNRHGQCRCKPGYSGKFCEKENCDDNSMSQILAFLAGILVGGSVTGVGCWWFAESVVDCRKRTKGCHCCRKDGHVNVQGKPDSARPSSSRRDVTVEEVPIYNEISTPRIERPGSVHTYEKIQIRRDPSRYDILINGRHGEITIDDSSIATKKESTRNRVENSVEVVEMANNEDRPLDTTLADAENISIDNSITANENTAIGNPSPFYFTLAKVDDEGTVNSPSQFRPVHIAGDTQFSDDDRPYFILEKEIDESAIQHVSTSTDDMAHGKIDNVQSECAGTDASENNNTHIECIEEK